MVLWVIMWVIDAFAGDRWHGRVPEGRTRIVRWDASAKHSTAAQELRNVRDLIWKLLGLTIAFEVGMRDAGRRII